MKRDWIDKLLRKSFVLVERIDVTTTKLYNARVIWMKWKGGSDVRNKKSTRCHLFQPRRSEVHFGIVLGDGNSSLYKWTTAVRFELTRVTPIDF